MLPMSFPFRAGDAAVGCELPGGLCLRTGGGGAILYSGGLGGGCSGFYQLISKSGWILTTTCSGALPPLQSESSYRERGMLMVMVSDGLRPSSPV